MYNPMLDWGGPEPPEWWSNCEFVQEQIRASASAGEGHLVTYWLNVLDLLDTEAAAYWRETGLSTQRNYRPC